jgi:tetratricopeptide (TPR) repeat protein
MIWKQMAAQCEEQKNWAGAEEALKNALVIEHENPRRELAVKTHLDLASLYQMLGRGQEALAEIESAVERSYNSEIEMIRAMALEAKARALLLQSDYAGARSVAADALAGIPDDKLYALMRARLLVLLARCDAHAGALDAAERHLDDARQRTSAYTDNGFLGGLQAYIAQASEVRT